MFCVAGSYVMTALRPSTSSLASVTPGSLRRVAERLTAQAGQSMSGTRKKTVDTETELLKVAGPGYEVGLLAAIHFDAKRQTAYAAIRKRLRSFLRRGMGSHSRTGEARDQEWRSRRQGLRADICGQLLRP